MTRNSPPPPAQGATPTVEPQRSAADEAGRPASSGPEPRPRLSTDAPPAPRARLRRRELAYEAALRMARPVLRRATSGGDGKVARGIEARAGVVERMERWASAERRRDRPLFWLHAPSVGEGLMAKAIIERIRSAREDAQVVFTHFSPSAERLSDSLAVDFFDYLPWDLRDDVARALNALRPDAILFVRTEIWPVLSAEASARGVRLALVNAVLGAGSSRLGGASRFLLEPAHARLHRVGAVAAGDAERFPALGVPPERVRVTGDARFDQVWERVRAARADPPALLERLVDRGVTTIVAGSTWPSDEGPLLRAVERMAPRVRLVIAPHEPTEQHLAALESRLDAHALGHRRISRVESADGPLPTVVVVDRLGILADLYGVADLAYVGGGFHPAGLHSVAEPAAFGIPVLFGPKLGNATEARELAGRGGGFEVGNATQLEARIRTLALFDPARLGAGERALEYVRSRLGGAAANATLALDLLEEA